MAKIIEAKREDRELPEAPESGEPGKVLDLMAALTESVQQAKASRGEDTEAEVHDLPAKKTTSKKTAAQKLHQEPIDARNARPCCQSASPPRSAPPRLTALRCGPLRAG
ncbi:hypothetical protein ACFYO2_48345 [Streptomyces sp. NPDC006602]|uniref:hypothetical protein n=1 Tax=Streptomyces sp. NPDC006602 TaxID=3364751 RepID=UPI003686BA66